MENLISIIIPVFNTGDPLQKCLESVISQDYESKEIIIIDDGSSDTRTLEILSKFQEEKNVRIIRQQNGGPSKARNTGIDKANGEFIAFVDSDDTIDKDAYCRLISLKKQTGADIVLGSLSYEEGNKIVHDTSLPDGTYEFNQIFSLFLQGKWHSTCTNLYTKKLIEGIRFPLNEINEDYIFNFHVLKRCSNIAVLNSPFYHYILRKNSRTSSPVTLKHLDWLKHTLYVKENTPLEFKNEAEYQHLFSNIVLANKCIINLASDSSDDAKEIYNITSRNLKCLKRQIRTNPFVNFKYRIMGYLIALMPSLYRNCLVLCLKIKKNIH